MNYFDVESGHYLIDMRVTSPSGRGRPAGPGEGETECHRIAPLPLRRMLLVSLEDQRWRVIRFESKDVTYDVEAIATAITGQLRQDMRFGQRMRLRSEMRWRDE